MKLSHGTASLLLVGACLAPTGVEGFDTTIKPKCLVVDAGSIPAASTPRASRTPQYARALTAVLAREHGWRGNQLACLIRLWTRESNFRPNALNKRSGAGGIPQILGLDPATPVRKQIQLGTKYIAHRYSTPCAALAHHNSHGWY